MNIRKPAVAGQFYPSDAQKLSDMINGFLVQVPLADLKGTPVAYLVPHAGYIYSGLTASYSYTHLSKHPVKNIVLIGNCHNYPLYCGAVFPDGVFKTPLGDIEINGRLAGQIIQDTHLLELNASPHVAEHSLEVQLPFLQKVLKGFQIVPILLGNFSLVQCQEIGEGIAHAITSLGLSGDTIIIASSDMSHYPSELEARETDTAALAALQKFDPPFLKSTIEKLMGQGITELYTVFCGEEALFSTMYASKSLGAREIKVLNYSNSAASSGDKSRVVGYGAAVFWK